MPCAPSARTKSAFDHDTAVAIISRTAPEHFDPAVLEVFKQNAGMFEEIFSAYSE